MGGKMDITVLEESTDPKVRDWAERLKGNDRKHASHMAPPGALNLPRFLDQRRIEYGIPDGAFRLAASFERIYIFQLPWDDKETAGDTMIIKSELTRARERQDAPLGILVGAGLKALDALRSNGIDLGHIVGILEVAPYRIQCDWVDGKTQDVLIMNAGDIIGSQDLAQGLASRKVRIRAQEVPGPEGTTIKQHQFIGEDGQPWNPVMPGMSFDQ